VQPIDVARDADPAAVAHDAARWDVRLRASTEEAVRLLDADGAVVYLVEPDGRLALAAEASPISLPPDHWLRTLRIEIGTGMLGRAVADHRVLVTGDYVADARSEHSAQIDAFAAEVGLQSYIVAPLVAGGVAFGALGVFDHVPDAFDDQQVALVRALADHAALEMANAKLIAELDRAREATARRAELERSLRELGSRIAGAGNPADVVQLTVDEATRLLGGDGGRIDVLGPDGRTLMGLYSAGREEVGWDVWEYGPEDGIGAMGMSGRAIVSATTIITADYLQDPGFVHRPGPDAYVRSKGVHGVICAPLLGGDGPFGTVLVWSERVDAFTEDDAALLEIIAGQAAVTLLRARLIEELGRSRIALEESEARYRSLVQSLPDLVFTCAEDGTITFMSGSVEDVLGWTPEEVVGRHFGDLMPERPDGGSAGRRFALMAANPGQALVSRLQLQARDGTIVPVEVAAAAIVRDGRFAGVHGSARDVGEQERLERELRVSEARYRYLVESSPDLVWMTDAEGCLTFVSDRARPVIGWDPAEVVGRSFADLAPDGRRRAALARFEWLRRHPTEPHRVRFRVVGGDGKERLVEVTGIGMVTDGTFAGAHGAARDIGEVDRLETDLRRQAAELAASEERAHLARELHDSVTQALFSMTLQVRSLELLLDREPGRVAGKLVELRELQRDALAEMRALIFELRPGNVEELGLVQALRAHAAGLSERIGLPIAVDGDLGTRPAPEVEDALYRIGQEGLHNVVRHAAASRAGVEISRVPDGVLLRVVDDGRGFDPATVPDGHLGLTGMRARAERLGGRFQVRSGPGEGTIVEAVVPAARPHDTLRMARGPA
jgi:PAS domain S-box-containing protein